MKGTLFALVLTAVCTAGRISVLGEVISVLEESSALPLNHGLKALRTSALAVCRNPALVGDRMVSVPLVGVKGCLKLLNRSLFDPMTCPPH